MGTKLSIWKQLVRLMKGPLKDCTGARCDFPFARLWQSLRVFWQNGCIAYFQTSFTFTHCYALHFLTNCKTLTSYVFWNTIILSETKYWLEFQAHLLPYNHPPMKHLSLIHEKNWNAKRVFKETPIIRYYRSRWLPYSADSYDLDLLVVQCSMTNTSEKYERTLQGNLLLQIHVSVHLLNIRKFPKKYHFMIRLQMKINCFPKPGKDVLDAPKLNFKRKTLIAEGLMIDISHYDPNHMRVRRQSQGPFWIWASLHLLPNFPSSPPQVLVPSSSTREPTRI